MIKELAKVWVADHWEVVGFPGSDTGAGVEICASSRMVDYHPSRPQEADAMQAILWKHQTLCRSKEPQRYWPNSSKLPFHFQQLLRPDPASLQAPC